MKINATFDRQSLAELLTEAAEKHHAAEKRLPTHQWESWYAAYIAARLNRFLSDESELYADRSILNDIKATSDLRALAEQFPLKTGPFDNYSGVK